MASIEETEEIRSMGGVVCTLGYLYCRSGCQASVVASALAFHPPIPTYAFKYDAETDSYSVEFDMDMGYANYLNYDMKENLHVNLIETKSKTKIPIFIYRHPRATKTILFSHGNASDCGIMANLYILIAARLKVNVVAYDYTGYGIARFDLMNPDLNPGKGRPYLIRPTEKQTYKDIEAVYEYILSHAGFKVVNDPSKELIIYGQSVG